MRIRIHFAKTEAMRFTGHLDLHRTWERIFRRANLPLAYSHGFHPQPRINLASALPLGFTSEAEVGDFWLEKDIALSEILIGLKKAAPPGIKLIEVENVDPKLPPLQTKVVASDYLMTILGNPNDLSDRLKGLLAAECIMRVWRGKEYNLRSLILDLQRLPDDEQGRAILIARLSTLPGATGRPEEILSILGIPLEQALVHRIKLYFVE